MSRARSAELQGLWVELEAGSADKGRKLLEASEQQQFYREVKDFDLWLDEVEKQLASDDLGKVGVASHLSLSVSLSLCFCN